MNGDINEIIQTRREVVDGVTIIYKKKDELTLVEQILLRCQPNKYIRKSPKKLQKRLEKIKPDEDVFIEQNQDFWDDYEEYIANPRKYKEKSKKKSRVDKLMDRYFKEQSDKDSGKDKLIVKGNPLSEADYVIYQDVINKHFACMPDYDMYSYSNKKNNPNVMFGNTLSKFGKKNMKEQKKASLLSSLENQILERLNEDKLALAYHTAKKKQKKKKDDLPF